MLLKHGFQYLVARGLPGIVNFLAIAIYTRLVNPEQYGAYTLTLATVSATDALLLHWLRLALLRFLPKSESEAPTALSTIFRLYFLISLGISALALAIGLLVFEDRFVRQLVILGTSLFVAQGWFELTAERERSELSPRRYGLYAGMKSVIGLTVGAGLAAAGLGAIGLLIGMVASLIVPLLTLGGARHWLDAARGRYNPALALRVTTYGLPLAATSILAFLVSGSDRFMLAAYIDTATAGQYAVGYDLAQFTLGLLLSIVNLAAYPLIVSAFERQGEEEAKRMLRWTLKLMLLVGLPATVGFAALSANIAGVLVGAEFEEAAALIIPWIAVASLLVGFKAFYFDLSFQLTGDTIVQVWVLFATAVLNIGLNLLLIPLIGIQGAVYSTVAAYAVAIGLSWWLGRNRFMVPLPDKSAIPIVIATIIMMVGLRFTQGWHGPLGLILQVLTGIVLYGAALMLIDRRYLHRLLIYEG